jgi:hypothetical protein
MNVQVYMPIYKESNQGSRRSIVYNFHSEKALIFAPHILPIITGIIIHTLIGHQFIDEFFNKDL